MAESVSADWPVIGEGVVAGRTHWELRAGGTDDDFATFVRAWDDKGALGERGFSGPLFPPDHLVNVYTGGGERGPRFIVVRANPSVHRLEIQLDRRRHAGVPLFGDSVIYGARFGVAFLDREATVRSMVARDAEGRRIDRIDLIEHQRVWDRFRLEIANGGNHGAQSGKR